MSAQTERGPLRAAALAYEPGLDLAPRLTAVGRGAVAEEIVRRAKQAGVTITQNEQLAVLLSQLDLDQAIPPELYVVVAEVLAYVHRLEARLAEHR